MSQAAFLDHRAEPLDPNRWAALAILLTGAFLAPLDFFIVNVAMPAITSGLAASAAEVQLVISGYAVVYAVFLITGGRLGDIFGRKTVFLVGLAGFAAASAFCGLAWSPAALIAARLLQGLAAAVMMPQALASIHALFPPHERARALSIYSIVVIGLSSIVGQLLGGALVAADWHGFGWRLIFLINLPIAIVAFALAVPLLRQTRGEKRPRLDFGGIVLSAAALASFIVPLVIGREQGWPWWSLALLAATPLLAEAFRRYELRLAATGGDPLVAFEIFETKGLKRGLAALMGLYAMAAFFLTYSIYLQTALNLTALQAGLAILPFSAGFLTGSALSQQFGRWFGASAPSVSFTLIATGLVLLSLAVGHAAAGTLSVWPWIVPPLPIIGLGQGVALPTMVRAIVERVAPHRAGLVGGMVNSTLQVSLAMSVAVLGGLFFTLSGPHADSAHIIRAFATTLLAIAACYIAAAVLANGLGPRRAAPLATREEAVVE
ncbi:MFS transporter [Methylovirgula sp. 4M-Z18]|uniref:MFS transporter n=1 Tax=Methylovirgula sp. 4M-Z18 TaxID=2293567 RepID=UPI000E2FEDB4|nr:MFS transporter [Methylovirgula sp. 4M-Z18]RFB75003.1 MFS transporter [Methylovirgula sp. 4M-Z18]